MVAHAPQIHRETSVRRGHELIAIGQEINEFGSVKVLCRARAEAFLGPEFNICDERAGFIVF